MLKSLVQSIHHTLPKIKTLRTTHRISQSNVAQRGDWQDVPWIPFLFLFQTHIQTISHICSPRNASRQCSFHNSVSKDSLTRPGSRFSSLKPKKSALASHPASGIRRQETLPIVVLF